MGKVISIVNNKGGVGKTTSTAIMGELLAYVGNKVLCIDLDAQCNLSMMLHSYVEEDDDTINGFKTPEHMNISDLFKYRLRDKEKIQNLIYKTTIENLYIIPSFKRHEQTISVLNQQTVGNNNIILKKAIDAIKNDFDYILIDNAPAKDVLTVNSMFASDHILVPVRLESFSYKGLIETMDTINYIIDEHGITSLDFLGAFVTQAEKGTTLYRDGMENYKTELDEKFFKTAIRKDIKVGEIETLLTGILEHSPNTNAVFDYANLLLEIGILDNKTQELLKACVGKDE